LVKPGQARLLLQKALDLALESAPRPTDSASIADLVLAALHARCLQCGQAVQLLSDSDYGDDATIVARGLYELTLTFRALARREDLISRYLCWSDFVEQRRASKDPEGAWLPAEVLERLERNLAICRKHGIEFKKDRHWYPG